MLIPFSMFSLDYDKGKVKYSPLYGRGSKVTILVGRHFQSGMLPMKHSLRALIQQDGGVASSLQRFAQFSLDTPSASLVPSLVQEPFAPN